jgi:hypothetical protein
MTKKKLRYTTLGSDTISEYEYMHEMNFVSSAPEDDSPGDSESDSGAEFMMGMSYAPHESEFDFEDSVELPWFREKDKYEVNEVLDDSLIEGVEVVSSAAPSPWMDLNADTDSN